MKEKIVKLLKNVLDKKNVDVGEKDIENFLEVPPSYEMGDYAFPCFFLAAKLKMSPHEIALDLRKDLKISETDFDDVQTAGPYINFFLNRKTLAINLISKVLKEKKQFGKLDIGKGKKTMIEWPSPNTNKPLHIGHLRNMAIGESVARTLEFAGEKVIRANLTNDRGIHICKSMAAYKMYGKNAKPGKTKPDHFVGKYYVMFGQKSKTNEKLELESHRMLQHWEEGDKETLELWKKMNNWAFEGFSETYKKFGIKPDKDYYESELYKHGKEIILDAVAKGIFQKRKDGAVVADLTKEGLGEKVLLRLDGTSVYITQDIYLAKLKFDQYKLDKSIYLTGSEQEYHFQVLFTLLKKLGFENKGLFHLSYGMVRLPSGKIKSREGTEGLTADEIINKVQELVKKELNSREKLDKKELEERSLKIALSAIKYLLLKVDSKKSTVFNPKESINFEGDTGPYILYSYARANSIIRKIKKSKAQKVFNKLEPKEIALAKKIEEFPHIVRRSYEAMNPSLIANYSYQLAQVFNEFYHDCPVMNSEKEEFRLKLVGAFKQVVENSLYLLGIDTLEEM